MHVANALNFLLNALQFYENSKKKKMKSKYRYTFKCKVYLKKKHKANTRDELIL